MLHRRPRVRTHEERVVAQVADVMWERETECILGVVFAELKKLSPEVSDLAADLLHRYQHYYRLWNVLDGLRADVAAVLQIRRQGEDEVNTLDDYVRSSLHWYARYQQLVRRFVDDYGAIWTIDRACGNAMGELQPLPPIESPSPTPTPPPPRIPTLAPTHTPSSTPAPTPSSSASKGGVLKWLGERRPMY